MIGFIIGFGTGIMIRAVLYGIYLIHETEKQEKDEKNNKKKWLKRKGTCDILITCKKCKEADNASCPLFLCEEGEKVANSGVYLEIDASDLSEEIDRLRSIMTEKQFNNAMHGIFKRTGSRVKTILGNDIPKDYQVKKAEVRRTVGTPSVTTSALGVGCSIPVKGARRGIGPGNASYSASGGARGWASLKKKYRVKAKILKSGASTLPANASSYGGEPPFRNLSAAALHNQTFTRKGKDRLPIEKVTGIAIPQMPLNRSENEVQRDIKEYMQQRMEARFQALIANGK